MGKPYTSENWLLPCLECNVDQDSNSIEYAVNKVSTV